VTGSDGQMWDVCVFAALGYAVQLKSQVLGWGCRREFCHRFSR